MGKCAIPRIHVRNLQRIVPVNTSALEKFAERATRLCVRIRRKERTELMRLGDIFVWLISGRRMSQLHRQFLGETGSTDVLTFQHGEIFISVETANGKPVFLETRSCASFSCTSSMAFYTCTDSTTALQLTRAKCEERRRKF